MYMRWDVGFGDEVRDRCWCFCWSGSGDGGVVYFYAGDASGFGEDAGVDAGVLIVDSKYFVVIIEISKRVNALSDHTVNSME